MLFRSMAIDLLSDRPPLHLYRHDLESLFWVMVWHINRYDNGEFRGNLALYENWTRASTPELAQFKRAYMHEGVFEAPESYQAFKALISHMRFAFRKGRTLLSDWEQFGGFELDMSTLNGSVTFDVLENLFTLHRPPA